MNNNIPEPTSKCFSCGINDKAPRKNVCAECLEKYPPQPRQPEQPDWADDIDDHPGATVTQDDLDSFDEPEDDPEWRAWYDDQD